MSPIKHFGFFLSLSWHFFWKLGTCDMWEKTLNLWLFRKSLEPFRDFHVVALLIHFKKTTKTHPHYYITSCTALQNNPSSTCMWTGDLQITHNADIIHGSDCTSECSSQLQHSSRVWNDTLAACLCPLFSHSFKNCFISVLKAVLLNQSISCRSLYSGV